MVIRQLERHPEVPPKVQRKVTWRYQYLLHLKKQPPCVQLSNGLSSFSVGTSIEMPFQQDGQGAKIHVSGRSPSSWELI